MTNFILLRPYLLLLIIPVIAIFYVSLKSKKNNQNHINQNLLLFLTKRDVTTSWLTPSVLLFFSSLLAIIALAGPAIPQKTHLSQQGGHLIVILGMDKSMYADDIKPSRLSITKKQVGELLRNDAVSNIALIAFSGSAHLISPFTDDHQTLIYFLESLTPDVMPKSGSNIIDAVKLAASLVSQLPPENNARLLLITDQLTTIQSKNLIEFIKPLGWTIDIASVGTQTGSVVPLPKGQLLRTLSGQLIVAKTPITVLTDTAKKLGSNILDISNLDKYIISARNHDSAILQSNATIYHEIGYIVLIPVLFISTLFRRGSMILILILISIPHTSYAKNSALELYEKGEYEAASHLFQNFIWKGNAMYKAGKYNEAIFFYEKEKSDVSNYNRGNALAHTGRIKEAIQAYNDALQLNPDLSAAIDNKKILELWLKKESPDDDFKRKIISKSAVRPDDIEKSLIFLKALPENQGELMKKRLQQQIKKTN